MVCTPIDDSYCENTFCNDNVTMSDVYFSGRSPHVVQRVSLDKSCLSCMIAAGILNSTFTFFNPTSLTLGLNEIQKGFQKYFVT